MRARTVTVLALAAILLTAAVGCSSGSSGSDTTAGDTTAGETTTGATTTTEASSSGVLRIGTVNYIDSLNPFHYIESQSTNAMIMIYPQLVQYAQSKSDPNKLVLVGDWADSWDHSADGKDWTFHLKPDTKWSDGKPMTAEDAAW